MDFKSIASATGLPDHKRTLITVSFAFTRLTVCLFPRVLLLCYVLLVILSLFQIICPIVDGPFSFYHEESVGFEPTREPLFPIRLATERNQPLCDDSQRRVKVCTITTIQTAHLPLYNIECDQDLERL